MKNINDIQLEQTCGACPEQYDAFLDGKIVGYLRLRHGYFRVAVPDCGGKTIYTAYPEGGGCFESDERDKYLTAAKEAILAELFPDELFKIWDEIKGKINQGSSFAELNKWYTVTRKPQ